MELMIQDLCHGLQLFDHFSGVRLPDVRHHNTSSYGIRMK